MADFIKFPNELSEFAQSRGGSRSSRARSKFYRTQKTADELLREWRRRSARQVRSTDSSSIHLCESSLFKIRKKE